MEYEVVKYQIDLDIYKEGYGVVETVKGGLESFDTFEEAMTFAKEYALDLSHFDFSLLKENQEFELTIRKYYSDGEWDDEDVVVVKNI